MIGTFPFSPWLFVRRDMHILLFAMETKQPKPIHNREDPFQYSRFEEHWIGESESLSYSCL